MKPFKSFRAAIYDPETGIETPIDSDPTAPTPREVLCLVISHSGLNGEPLACAYSQDHDGNHSWASLPTFPSDAAWRSIKAVIDKWRYVNEARPEPIDVERLARAIHEYSHLDSESECDAPMDARELLARLAEAAR